MSGSDVRSQIGAPQVSCVVVKEVRTPDGGQQITITTTEYYYSRLGLILEFWPGKGLNHVTIEEDWEHNLTSFVDPLGNSWNYSCQGPNPVRVRATSVTYDAGGVSLGSLLEKVLEIFGKPSLSSGQSGQYGSRGMARAALMYTNISFFGWDGRVVAILVKSLR
jgi:hypothetical protein